MSALPLSEIARIIGLHPKSLYVYRERHGESFPDPVQRAGKFALYDPAEIVAWHTDLTKNVRAQPK